MGRCFPTTACLSVWRLVLHIHVAAPVSLFAQHYELKRVEKNIASGTGEQSRGERRTNISTHPPGDNSVWQCISHTCLELTGVFLPVLTSPPPSCKTKQKTHQTVRNDLAEGQSTKVLLFCTLFRSELELSRPNRNSASC